MKSLKILFLAILVLFLSFLGTCISCGSVNAATRVGVFDVRIADEEVMPRAAGLAAVSNYKKYQQLQNRYHEILMKELSQTGIFEAVDLRLAQEEYTTAMGYNNKVNKNGVDYRPHVNRSMTGQFSPEQAAEKYNKYRIQKARNAKCLYMIDVSLTFDNSSKKEINVEAYFHFNDVNNGNFKAFLGDKIIPVSNVKKTKSSKSNKSKTDLKEQAAIEAFSRAIEAMREDIMGDFTKVAEVKGSDVILNKGSSSKVRVGDSYRINMKISDGMEDVFGETPVNSVISLAMVKVKDVQDTFSTAEIIIDAGNISNIRAGDMAEPIIASHVDTVLSSIASHKIPPFPEKRPELKAAKHVQTAQVKQDVKEDVKNNSKKRGKKGSKQDKKQNKNQNKQLASKLEPLPALPPGTVRVGVMRFDSKIAEISDKEASTLTDLFMRMLSNSDKIAVLERDRLEAVAREQKLNLSGIIDPATAAKIGKLAGCQYMLLGSVTGFDESDTISGRYIRPTQRSTYVPNIPAGYELNTAGKVLVGLQLLGAILKAAEGDKDNVVTETHEVITNVDARLVDVSTSQIKATFSERGSAAQSDVITQDKDGYVKNVEATQGGLQAQSIASAASHLSHKIRENLTGECVQISSVSDGEIIINRGAASGVHAGDLFCVYADGQSDGDTEAIISIKDVQDAFSTAEVVKSLAASYSPAPGYRLESVLHSDFQKGIWHIKNQKRAQAAVKANANMSISDLASGIGKRKRFETSSTETKKVIKSYGLDAKKEKALIEAHSKAAKASSTKKKYESYKQLSEADVNDFLAAYNTGRYALELSMYVEAREWASKALFINPKYKPAIALIEKIDKD